MTPFEIAKLVIMAVGTIAALTILCNKKRGEGPCDSCEMLNRKHSWLSILSGGHRYDCAERRWDFNVAPKYCAKYRKRETEDG